MNTKLNNEFIELSKKYEFLTEELEKVKSKLDKLDGEPLRDFNPGSTVKIGNREYIILNQRGDETTEVITKEFVKKMTFGETGDYLTSEVRNYCEGEFYEELVKTIGKENICWHMVRLEADDGTGKSNKVEANVSVLTTYLYRRYRKFLPAYGDWWWTATKVSDDSLEYDRYVYYIGSHGVLNWENCGYSRGVRPYCILKSSILVNEVK